VSQVCCCPNKRLKLPGAWVGRIAFPRQPALFLCGSAALRQRVLRPQLKRDPLGRYLMTLRPLALGLALLSTIAVDCYQYALVTAPLTEPLDSTCLKAALARRLGAPSLRPILEKRTQHTPAALWLYYGHASFTQIYADSVVTLTAAQPISSGLFSHRSAEQDSVSRGLGVHVLAVRDACGGRALAGRPELTFGR